MIQILNNKLSYTRKTYKKSDLPIIKKEHLEILYGLVLGDVFISRVQTENARLKFEQSVIHEEYLKHLFEIFQYLCTENAIIKNTTRNTKGIKTYSVYFVTRRLVHITSIHTLFYSDKIKKVPLNIASLLTPISLAYWVMDDGSNHNSGFILNTQGFIIQDLELLQVAMFKNWDIETSICKDNKIYIKSRLESIYY